MAAPFRLEGLEKLQAKLKALPKHLKEEIDMELQASAFTIEAAAKRDAPKDVGFLVNEISSFKSGELQYDVVSAASYSLFAEVGTRGRTQIPPGAEEFISQYNKTKTASSLGAREAIYGWCKRKGIEHKLWYPIFISLMVKGVTPHPFFFKNYFAEKPKLIARIKKIVTDVK